MRQMQSENGVQSDQFGFNHMSLYPPYFPYSGN